MIYLDHAAATPVSRKALAAMAPYFDEQFFNPSAPYLSAKRVREAYESAKSNLAHLIGAKSSDLIMTSGATESINLAFTAVEPFPGGKILHSAAEHPAILAAASTYPHDSVKVDKIGRIDLTDLQQKLDDSVVLVSVALVASEIGTINSLPGVTEVIRAAREDRLARGVSTPLYLHSDASQALSLLDINVARLGVDLLTISSAKCGGPKGVGALYVGRDVKLRPLMLGGGQEMGLRSGTENVPGVVGFAAAAEECHAHLASNRKKYAELAKLFRETLLQVAPGACSHPAGHQTWPERLGSCHPEGAQQALGVTGVEFLGNPKHQLASFIPLSFPGVDAERLIYKLEQQEIYVSTGAACAASKGERSHVLSAIGLSPAEIAGSLRISLGATNTREQMTIAATAIAQAVNDEYQRLDRGA